MYHNRIIPCLLLDGQDLVKTINFENRKYLGDPINAVKIYNDSEVDELIILDINATRENRGPDFSYLEKITQQCFMPICYGGGVKNIEDVRHLFEIGFEKVSVNSALKNSYELLQQSAEIFGSQSIVGAIDIRTKRDGKRIYFNNGREKSFINPIEHVKNIEKNGAGEILINSIDRDGCMNGYDLELISDISRSVGIPIIACGGAGSLSDCKKAIEAGASAAAAGSLFVYWGRKHAVLINYPESEEIDSALQN